MPAKNVQREAHRARSTRDVVETAIELSKNYPTGNWTRIAEKRISNWRLKPLSTGANDNR